MRKQILLHVAVFLFSGLMASMAQTTDNNTEANDIINKGNDKLRVFVMDFNVYDKKYKKAASSFTDDFETAIIKEDYDVLLRSGYTKVLKAQNIENEIYEILDLPIALKDSLELESTDAVFFGKLVFDDGSGEFELTVRLQPLDINKPTLKKGQITFKKGIINDNNTRKSIAKDMVKLLHSAETLSLKEEQLNIIEKKLSTYRARVKEVIDIFEEKIGLLLEAPRDEVVPHLKEIHRKREAFNIIWNDLNKNKVKYTKDFGRHWGEESRIALKYVYSETMDDFHIKFKNYVNNLETRINDFRVKKTKDFGGKRKRKEAKNALVKEVKYELLKLLDEDYYNDVDRKINAFLQSLGEEIIKEMRQND